MVDLRTGEEAINRGLAKRLQQLADERERRERAALAADAEFTAEFLSAARAVRSPRPIEPTSPRVWLPLVLRRASLDPNAPSP